MLKKILLSLLVTTTAFAAYDPGRYLNSATDSVTAVIPGTLNVSPIGTFPVSNSSLTSIDSKTPALGQALAAGSIPVVLTAAQLSTLAPLSSVSVSNFPSSQAVTGTFWQATQPVSGSLGRSWTLSSGTDSIGVTGTFWQATQPVSAASLPLPSGASTSALQTSGNSSLSSLDSKSPSLVSGRVPVDGSGVTQPVSGIVTSSFSDTVASGSITTQNLVPAESATAGSSVASGSLNGAGTAEIQVTGTYTGALSVQYTIDGSNWITGASTTLLNMNSGSQTSVIGSAANGIYQIGVSGIAQFRVTALAAVTGTAVVSIRTSPGTSAVNILNLPPGSSTSALQTTGNTSLSTIASNTTGVATSALQSDQSASGTISALNQNVVITGMNGIAEGAFNVSGTWVGSLQAQGSIDGVTWDTMIVFQGGLWSTAAVTTNGNFRVSGLASFKQFRVIFTAYTSGSAVLSLNATRASNILNIKQGTAANLKTLAQITDTNGNTLNAANGALNIAPMGVTLTANAVSALNGDLVAPTNVSGYGAVFFSIYGTWSGTITVQGSNDPAFSADVTSVIAVNPNSANNLPVSTITANGSYTLPVNTTYIRIRMTAYTSGTANAFATATTATPNTLGQISVPALTVGAPAVVTYLSSQTRTSSSNSGTLTASVISQGYTIVTTAVSGTNPTMDVTIEESLDNGGTWNTVWAFERITGTGSVKSPPMKLQSNLFRVVYTIGGTTPSFTFVVQGERTSATFPLYRRVFDRTLVTTTTATPGQWVRVDGCKTITYGVALAASGFTPAFDLQFSEDQVVSASAGVPMTFLSTDTEKIATVAGSAAWARVVTTTAGVGSALNYDYIRCVGD